MPKEWRANFKRLASVLYFKDLLLSRLLQNFWPCDHFPFKRWFLKLNNILVEITITKTCIQEWWLELRQRLKSCRTIDVAAKPHCFGLQGKLWPLVCGYHALSNLLKTSLIIWITYLFSYYLIVCIPSRLPWYYKN